MKHNNFGYLMGEGVRAMFKHGFMSFAAICITVACLVIINSFMLITYNLNLTVVDFQDQMRMVACITLPEGDAALSDEEITRIRTEINALENVKTAEYKTSGEAFEEFKLTFEDPTAFEGVDSKTMRDQIVITLMDNSKVADTQKQVDAIEGIDYVYADIETANSLATIRTVLYIASMAITLVLLVVSLVIISNTIRLAMLDRKEEIAIMKMVGATNSFIRFPFFVEGCFLGLFSAAFSFFIEWGLYEVIRTAILKTGLKVLTIVPFTDMLLPMIAICTLTGFTVGIFGSLMSVRRFLKV